MSESKEAFTAALQITLACVTAKQSPIINKESACEINEFFETVFMKLSSLHKMTSLDGPIVHTKNS
jgi:hypothetical protein